MVVGHRGWRSRYPDNTLAGFISASIEADAIETDVRRCGDGRLVLSHDPVLDGLEVASTGWSVLCEVDLGDGHHPALLDEAIAAVPRTGFQFEVKNLPHEPGFEPDHRVALETAERSRPGDIVTSFNWESLVAVRRVFPDVATGVIVGGYGDIGEAVSACLAAGHRAVVPSIELPLPGMTGALEAGLEVYPWVVGEPERARELAGLGVTGIITDDPDLVRSAVGRQP